MGLKSHTFVLTAGHVERGEALDRDDASISRVDRVASGPPDQSKRTWRFKGVITAEMLRRGSHLSRPIAIQGATSKAFLTFIYGSNRGRPSHSDGHDLIETVHDGPFHRNRRSKRSDGYAQILFK